RTRVRMAHALLGQWTRPSQPWPQCCGVLGRLCRRCGGGGPRLDRTLPAAAVQRVLQRRQRVEECLVPKLGLAEGAHRRDRRFYGVGNDSGRILLPPAPEVLVIADRVAGRLEHCPPKYARCAAGPSGPCLSRPDQHLSSPGTISERRARGLRRGPNSPNHAPPVIAIAGDRVELAEFVLTSSDGLLGGFDQGDYDCRLAARPVAGAGSCLVLGVRLGLDVFLGINGRDAAVIQNRCRKGLL